MKRLLSFLSLLIVAVSSFAQTFTVGDLTYKVLSEEDKTAQVWNGKSATGAVVVPETVTYNNVDYRVTTVYGSAFSSNTNITSVNLPSVTSIGSSAFYKCSSLTSIELPAATSIGNQAFYQCPNISSLRIGSIEQWCNVKFYDNYSCPLYSLSQSANLYIGNSETPATEIEVPSSVTQIPASAFKQTTITSISAPSVISVGDAAFNHCKSITNVNFPVTTSIGSYTFAGCDCLSNVNLPAVNTIGTYAFSGCYSLISVDFPSATSVGNYAFIGCASLEEALLPNVKTIGQKAFYDQDVSNLKNSCPLLKRVVLTSATFIGEQAFRNCTSLSSIELPAATSIGSSAFYNCSSLIAVTLPAATSIGNDAFRECSNLVYASLPVATTIGTGAFNNCSSLESLDLSAATSIGSSAFYNCSSLESLDLSAATSIGSNAFYGCTKINSLRIGSVEQWCKVNLVGNGSPLQYTSQTVELYIGNSETPATEIEVPNTVTSIPNSAFRRTIITSVTAPAATSIGSEAFYSCSSLASVELPAATSIGNYAFSSCSSLASVELPVATSIDNYAFQSCSSLATISLPVATSIGDYVFNRCNTLISLELPEVITIGNGAFANNTTIEYLSIPKVEKIGDSTFANGTSIKALRIGSVEQYLNIEYTGTGSSGFPLYNGTTHTLLIGDSDTPATEITIPASVQKIPQYALRNTDIHTIHFEGTTPPTLVNTNSLPTSTMLVVSAEAYETYLATDVYKTIPLQITKDGYITRDVEIIASNSTSALLAKIGEQNVRYVVNLKIKGTINSYDMLIIRNQMTSLRNLDLTEASIVDCDYVYSNANGNSFHSIKDAITGEWLQNAMNIKLPATTKTIDTRAFYMFKNLVSIEIPEGVNSIGKEAFYGCSRIKEITLPKSVMSFGYEAFYHCTGLKEVVLPEGITSVGSFAFFECTDLEKISIPASLTLIGEAAFANNKPLELHICSLDSWLNVNIEATDYNFPFSIVDKLYLGESDEPVENLVIPNGTSQLKKSVFAGFKCFNNVTLPETLTSIGSYAFRNCSGLTEIIIPQRITSINSYTFSGCSNLENVEFTNGITYIGSYAFSGCKKLTKIELPPYLKTIGSYAFNGCTSLQEVLIPASLTKVYDYAFQGCSNLNTVIATTVEPIAINQNTFSTYQTANLYSPKTSYYKYYWNTQWNQFLTRKEYDKEFAKSFGYKYFYLNGVNGDNNEDFEITDETGPLHGVGDDNPDADFNEGAGMIVGGEQIQNLGDIHIHHNGNNGASVIAKNSGKLHIDNLYVDIKTQKNRWYFFCFPFDIKPGEATYDGSHVWYLYDGEARALNGNGGWKKVAADGVMKSGNGYIFQGAVNGTLTIHVQDITIDTNDASTNMITYQSDNKNDASWNLIGNANFAYYDIDNLGYDAPITVYNNETGNYEAVRAEDEDYEFYPFQAFFVQKPEGTDAMTFEATKKETKNKSDENKAKKAAARAGAPKKVDPSRQLINLELSAVDLTEDAETATAADRTRIVVNAAKSLAYEPECDAAKFIADGMPQIYSLDAQNTMYAINERPAADGIVPLAVKITEEGFYTISASRLDCAAQLRDLETGDVIDLAEGDYTFAAKAKTYSQRFQLLLADAVEGIEAIEVADAISVEAGAIAVNDQRADVKIYTAGGVLVAAQKGLGSVKVPAGVYVINVNGQSTKVTVKE